MCLCVCKKMEIQQANTKISQIHTSEVTFNACWMGLYKTLWSVNQGPSINHFKKWSRELKLTSVEKEIHDTYRCLRQTKWQKKMNERSKTHRRCSNAFSRHNYYAYVVISIKCFLFQIVCYTQEHMIIYQQYIITRFLITGIIFDV